MNSLFFDFTDVFFAFASKIRQLCLFLYLLWFKPLQFNLSLTKQPQDRSFFVITSFFFAMLGNWKQTHPFHPIFASQTNDNRASSR